ncbi:MAG: glycosyl transferase family 2 [Rhizobiaceae bacterium]|nr:glycosyl transferase family 2 [Rhizobiaceae bacterium]
MLTVMIEAGADQGPLVASLATLIPGAVEGLVREVVVIDRGLDPATRKVADHAGCRIVDAAGLAAVVSGARGDWLLLLEAGARLAPDWIDAVTSHLVDVEEANVTPRAARFSRSRRDMPGFLSRFLSRRTALAEGLLLPKAQAIGLVRRSRTLEDMAKGLASRRLDASIRPRLLTQRA